MDLWEVVEYLGEALVFVGVIIEVFAEWGEPEKKKLAKVGSIVLVIGLAISLSALIGTNEYFNGTIADLNLKASQAKERGDTANLEAERLRLRAEELEERILEQGPRDLILYGKRADALVNGLTQFKGQKVQVRICQFNDKEIRDTAERLTALFRLAKWGVSPGSPDWGESNCTFPPDSSWIEAGLWVGMPSASPTALTRERAGKLLELLKAVPLAAKLHKVRPETARSGPEKPNVEIYAAPDSIVVVVFPHSSPSPTSPPAHGLGFGP
jgi:hypothetical protein